MHTHGQATLKYLNNDLFTLKLAKTQDIYGIKSDEIINKYLAIENNNLQELVGKYSQDIDVPNQLKLNNIDELLSLTDLEKEHIENTYISMIKENIPKTAFSKQKDVSITVFNKNIVANQYELKLTEKQAKTIYKNVLEQLNNDTAMLNIILNKLQMLDENVTLDNIKTQIQQEINNLNKEESGDGTFLTITLFENEKKLVRTQIEVDSEKLIIDYETTNNAIRILVNMSSFNVLDLNSIELLKQENNGEKYQYIIANLKTENGTSIIGAQDKSKTLTDGSVEDEITVNINLSNKTYLKINIDKQTIPSSSVDIEELDDTNSAKVNDFTVEYTVQLIEALQNRIQQVYEEKLNIVQNLSNEDNQTDNNENTENTDNTNNIDTNTVNNTIDNTTNTIDNSVENNITNTTNEIIQNPIDFLN